MYFICNKKNILTVFCILLLQNPSVKQITTKI